MPNQKSIRAFAIKRLFAIARERDMGKEAVSDRAALQFNGRTVSKLTISEIDTLAAMIAQRSVLNATAAAKKNQTKNYLDFRLKVHPSKTKQLAAISHALYALGQDWTYADGIVAQMNGRDGIKRFIEHQTPETLKKVISSLNRQQKREGKK